MRTPIFLCTLGLALFDMGGLKAFELRWEAYIFGSLLLCSLALLYLLARPLFPKA
jgi:hypothetical protein